MKLSKEQLLSVLSRMLLIRHFETRAEAAYQQGKIGGFMHSYAGQEAIAVACADVIGRNGWWSGSYRCHAYALMLGATPEEAMCELFGRANGNAAGKGGSMHLYTDRLMGGAGIVGGQIPVAIGAAFSAKYRNSGEVALCFMGDGAVAQGTFHESLNLASLWSLPAIFVIENNHWGMGTGVNRAISVEKIAEKKGPSFGIEGITCDGMDYFACRDCFDKVYASVKKTNRPVIIEMVTERFRGHSISDPALYRSKEALKECMKRDPIVLLVEKLEKEGVIDEAGYKALDKEVRERIVQAVEFADASPWPEVATLEEGVYAGS